MKNEKILHIITNAKKGSQSAFSELLQFYWDEVYFYILKQVKNPTQTEDIVIQTFAKAFQKIEQYDSKHQMNTWLIAIAKNLHIDQTRKRQLHTVDLNTSENQNTILSRIIDDSKNIEDQIIYEQKLASLHVSIKDLPEGYKQIIQLRYFQEKSYKEIAEINNEPLNTIRVKLLRAKKLLIEILNKQTN